MTWQLANQLLVKEHVGLFKASSNYDVFDLNTGEKVLECREPALGFFTRLLRFTDYKRMTPFDVHVTDTNGTVVLDSARSLGCDQAAKFRKMAV